MFLAFAFSYFLAALLRAGMAALAPMLNGELSLGAGDLGLLACAHFLGFAAMQLPLGRALDHLGPKRVLLVMLSIAVMGCTAFALSYGLPQLLLARLLIGVGVSACLMAPLTCFRHRFGEAAQLLTNSWMLMIGSLGMLSSTVPVQGYLPVWGWRGLFVMVAGLLLAVMLLVAALVPTDGRRRIAAAAADASDPMADGYRAVFRHPPSCAWRRLASLPTAAWSRRSPCGSAHG